MTLFDPDEASAYTAERCPNDPGCSHALGWHDPNGRCEYGECLCGMPPMGWPTSPARATDRATSHAAAKLPFRRNSQRYELLCEYEYARATGDDGLTDEEAAYRASINKGCPWKRCSELREAGYIAPIGITRLSDGGAQQNVCAITEGGRAILSRYPE